MWHSRGRPGECPEKDHATVCGGLGALRGSTHNDLDLLNLLWFLCLVTMVAWHLILWDVLVSGFHRFGSVHKNLWIRGWCSLWLGIVSTFDDVLMKLNNCVEAVPRQYTVQFIDHWYSVKDSVDICVKGVTSWPHSQVNMRPYQRKDPKWH